METVRNGRETIQLYLEERKFFNPEGHHSLTTAPLLIGIQSFVDEIAVMWRVS
jgi:hypothetical protein